MRELWFQITHTSGAKVYSVISGIVILFLTARWLGPDGRGVVAAITTWVSLFSTVGFLSLGQVALHLATRRREEDWLPAVFGGLLFVTALVTVAGWTTAALLQWDSRGRFFGYIDGRILGLGFLLLPFLVWEQYGSSLLAATNNLAVYNRAQVVGRTVGIVAVIVLLWIGFGIAGVLLATLGAQATVASTGIRCLWSEAGSRLRLDWLTVRELVAGGLKLHLTAVGSYLFSSASILIIDHFRDKAETGQYQLAMQLVSVMLIAPQSASMVLFSKMSRVGVDGVWAFQKKILRGMTLIMLLGAAASMLVAPFLIEMLAGPLFAPSAAIFRILLLSVVGIVFSSVMGPQWIGRGLFWQSAAITLTCGCLSVGLAFWWVPQHGMHGAAWAFVVTYALSFAVNAILALRVDLRLEVSGT